jgi:PAS domain-containing protein
MEEQSKLAEKILDQVADAVICADHSGTMIRWNHASTALFGYSAEETLGSRAAPRDNAIEPCWTRWPSVPTTSLENATQANSIQTQFENQMHVGRIGVSYTPGGSLKSRLT